MVPPLFITVMLSGSVPPVVPDELLIVTAPPVPALNLSVSAEPPEVPFKEPSISIAAPADTAPPFVVSSKIFAPEPITTLSRISIAAPAVIISSLSVVVEPGPIIVILADVLLAVLDKVSSWPLIVTAAPLPGI